MVKRTQKIRRKFADELSLFDHFVGLALKGLFKTNQYLSHEPRAALLLATLGGPCSNI